MDLRTIAEKLNAIQAARGNAADGLTQSIRALYVSYSAYDRAHTSARKLAEAGAIGGEQGRELVELCEHLADSREIVAEVVLALCGLHPVTVAFEEELAGTGAAARAGMQSKRLAEWEVNALREAVAAALKGPTIGTEP